MLSGGDDICPKQALQFLYAFGATLNVAKPATALLSTGSVAFPLNRPVCAAHERVVSLIGTVADILSMFGCNKKTIDCHVSMF